MFLALFSSETAFYFRRTNTGPYSGLYFRRRPFDRLGLRGKATFTASLIVSVMAAPIDMFCFYINQANGTFGRRLSG